MKTLKPVQSYIGDVKTLPLMFQSDFYVFEGQSFPINLNTSHSGRTQNIFCFRINNFSFERIGDLLNIIDHKDIMRRNREFTQGSLIHHISIGHILQFYHTVLSSKIQENSNKTAADKQTRYYQIFAVRQVHMR